MNLPSRAGWIAAFFLIDFCIGLDSRATADGPNPGGANVPARGAEIEPLPPAPIPDDPPPHEGAMIVLPWVIEPPDLIVVEVLEALPGRPISGERLVRPDGCVSLGFYGDIYLRGLTTQQAKEKTVDHLRQFLPDDVLGLYKMVESVPPDPGANEPAPRRDSTPKPPTGAIDPGSSGPPNRGPDRRPTERMSSPRRGGLTAPRFAVRDEPAPRPDPLAPPETETPDAATGRIEVPQGRDLKGPLEPDTFAPRLANRPGLNVEEREEGDETMEPGWKKVRVSPADSNRVFVDVRAYNSKAYYVQGDVATPGRIPWTGNETVLDAMNYAGGPIASADLKNIQLVRPARGGKPVRVYRVDLDAITRKGDARANYQLFPGDRLVVGRLEIVQKTIEFDRVRSSLLTVINSFQQYVSMARTLAQPLTPGGPTLSPEQRQVLLEEWLHRWWELVSRPGGATLDEKALREALLRRLDPPAGPDAEKK